MKNPQSVSSRRLGSAQSFRSEVSIFAIVLVAASFGITGCSNSAQTPTPSISEGLAPAPGSQTGLRSVADVDYEQITLSADTQLIKLAELAQDPKYRASSQVKQLAKQVAEVAGPDAQTLRLRLVKAGDALADHHGHGTKSDEQLRELKSLKGPSFDKLWMSSVARINNEIIAAATIELNQGEDQETRALARQRVESASKLKSQLNDS